MRLLRFKISARRGEPPRDLDFGTQKGGLPFIAVTGPEGAGKSSLLEAIALHKEHLAPYGPAPPARALTRGEPGPVEMESEWLLDDIERTELGTDQERYVARSRFEDGVAEAQIEPELIHVLARFHRDPVTSKVDLFPESRLARSRSGAMAGNATQWQRRHRLGRDTAKYVGLLKLVAEASDEEFERVQTLTTALLPGLEPKRDGLTFGTPHGERSLGELSLSQRLAFEMAATFALVGLGRSVVLVDGVERGFPSGSALRIVDALRAFAPGAQLIVTTNDATLLTVPDGKTIYLS